MNLSDFCKDKPIIFFDLETTGTNIQLDRIIEIATIKIFPDGKRQEHSRLLNPEMHITDEASEVHHIYDEDVKNEKTFSEIADKLFLFFEGCDLAGYNLTKFDIPILEKEFKSCGYDFSMEGRNIIDAYSIFRIMEPRDLTAAYKFYCGRELGDAAHGAMADTMATLEVFDAQLQRYSSMNPDKFPTSVQEFPTSISQLHEFCIPKRNDVVDEGGRLKWRNKEAVFAFGKYNGKSLKQVSVDHPDFLRWILNSDFSEELKDIVRDALIGKFPIKK